MKKEGVQNFVSASNKADRIIGEGGWHEERDKRGGTEYWI